MRKKHILVVDDEPTLLMTYHLILEMQGYHSTEVGTVAEAKHILDTQDVDLVLCDLTLIGESGLAVIDYARSRSPHLPAALLTGFNTQELEEWASLNNVELLQKPIAIPQLLESVNSLLRIDLRKTA